MQKLSAQSLALTTCVSALSALLVVSGCAGSGEALTGGGGSTGNPGSSGSTGNPGSSGGTGNPGSAGTTGTGSSTGLAGNTGGPGAAGTTGSGSTTGSAGATVTGTAGTTALPPPPSALPTEKACTSNDPGPRLVRRLTASEFTTTIRSIFSDTAAAAPVASVFSDPIVLGFSVDANALLVQGLNASQLMDNAEAIGAWAASSNKLQAFGNCNTKDAACALKFAKGFGQKAFRMKLADSDTRLTPYVNLFNAETTFSDAAQAVIAAMLQSPYFVYRSEIGAKSGTDFPLTSYEVASSLSYLLTGNMPDDTLAAAADQVTAGSLTMTAMIDQQSQRLLAAGTASNQFAVMGFMNGWLGLDRLYANAKDDTVYALTKAMRDDMASETRGLVLEAFNGNGGFAQLLTADHTFLNKNLATFYGLPSVALGSTQRDGGLLAQASLMVGYSRPETSSPTQRGHLVRTRLLCQDVPPPPSDQDTTFKPAVNAVTTRDHYEIEHDKGTCNTCHQMMDPIGFGFENYDGFGRYRTTENGAAINDAGKVVSANTTDGTVSFTGLSGPGSLQAYLATNADVKSCMVRHWAYYAYGTSSWAQDACTYNAIRQEATGGNYALKSVLMGILHAPRFTRRTMDP